MTHTAQVVVRGSATGAAATAVFGQNLCDHQPKAGTLDWKPVATNEIQVQAARRKLREWMRWLRAARRAWTVMFDFRVQRHQHSDMVQPPLERTLQYCHISPNSSSSLCGKTGSRHSAMSSAPCSSTKLSTVECSRGKHTCGRTTGGFPTNILHG